MFKIIRSGEYAQLQQGNAQMCDRLSRSDQEAKLWEQRYEDARLRARRAERETEKVRSWADKIAHVAVSQLDSAPDEYLIHLAGYAKTIGETTVLRSLNDELGRRGLTTDSDT